MNKISPIGAFCIALFVTRWNQWFDVETKNNIRNLLLSRNPDKVNAAIKELEIMTLNSLAWQTSHFNLLSDRIGDRFIASMCTLFTAAPENTEQTQTFYAGIQEKSDLTKDEIVFYFTAMFKDGHFEKLPLPDLSYGPRQIVVERRILSPEGKMSVAGPQKG